MVRCRDSLDAWFLIPKDYTYLRRPLKPSTTLNTARVHFLAYLFVLLLPEYLF